MGHGLGWAFGAGRAHPRRCRAREISHDPARHRPALARLAPFLAPPGLGPLRLAAEVAPIVAGPAGDAPLPPLLQTYLAMGGWVSDHAVVDRELDTLHVFTGVEIAAIPPARARLLRAMAAGEEEF